MENEILDTLEDLGYQGVLLDKVTLDTALNEGANSIPYTQLIEWLVNELAIFNNIEEKVNAIITAEDAKMFLLELSGFLREYGCPYKNITNCSINDRLASRECRTQLLDFLLSELCACRILADSKPHCLNEAEKIEMKVESDIANNLKLACMVLGLPKPPSNITPFQLFSKIEAKVKELLGSLPTGYLGNPLLNCRLSDKQWNQLLSINSTLMDEYRIRREMLLKRLDVTIQSFMWSDKAKSQENKIAAKFQPLRSAMVVKTYIFVPQILAAREDLTQLKKTSSGDAREVTKCAVNKIEIGRVPDRGGRAWEHERPPPEMPSFMKRKEGGGRGGSSGVRGFARSDRGGGDRGGRGGRVQGSWSGGNQKGSGGGWNSSGGQNRGYQGDNYQQGGGGQYQHSPGGGGGFQQGYQNPDQAFYRDSGRGSARGGRGGRGSRGRY